MRLFIAEKPSLGRAIADVLPKPLKKSEGFITASNGDVVSWCIGHLLEQAEPEVYNADFKKWSHEHLPIVPQEWQLKAKPRTSKQLTVLRRLVKQADQLIHAGDPDREGQLLVDEIINFFGVNQQKKAQMKRCLISDLNPQAVKRAISVKHLRSNREFIPLSTSALARSRADWLFGINLTRAYTLQGQKAGYNGVLSVGRVQTPVLGLVVRRDEEILNFVSKPFYEVWANLITGGNDAFKAKWVPSKSCEDYLDDQGRNVNKALADNVANRISNTEAHVTSVKRELKKQVAPLPYNLSSLQIDANKAFGLSAQQVLDICQTLYERHKLITYPRSDCRYLPKDHFIQADAVVSVVKSNVHSTKFKNAPLDLNLKSRAWNDAKVSAHHGIIPTQKKYSVDKLSNTEAKIYELVCRNYLAQFLPENEYYANKVEVRINTGLFKASVKEESEPGWKYLFPVSTKSNNEVQQKIPCLQNNQSLRSLNAEVIEKNTSAPKAFTDATLLAAMTGISAHVSDPKLKKVLRETDGLGTEATRAGIIELLFKRQYLRRQGKAISSTATGQALINALPDLTTFPDLTALWESTLTAIHEGKASYAELMLPLEQQLQQLVVDSQQVVPHGLNGLGGRPSYKKRTKKKSSFKKAKQAA
jgi:DNA topoisomerase-3